MPANKKRIFEEFKKPVFIDSELYHDRIFENSETVNRYKTACLKTFSSDAELIETLLAMN